MKLLFNAVDGEIFYATYDKDVFSFVHSTNIELTEFEIDEVDPDNKALCYDLSRNVHKKNSEGLGKYYIDGATLYERDNWEEVYNA